MKRVRVYNAFYGLIRAIIPFLAVSVLYVRTEDTTPVELFVLFAALSMVGAAANLSKLEGVGHRIVLLYATGAGILVMLGMGLFSIVVTSLLLLTIYLKKQDQLPLMDWILLEQESRDRFYRIANWFVDVPRLSTTYKRRRLLSHLVEKIGFNHKRTFDYLYLKQFIRSTDGIGLIIRLTLIGILFMWLGKDNEWLVTLAVPAFGGLTSFQLAPFTRAIDSHLLTRLLPFGDATASKRKVLRLASFLQVLILSLAGFILSGFVTVFVGAFAALVIGEYYSRKK